MLLRRGGGGGAARHVGDRDGNTALHVACAWGREAATRTLLALGSDANAANREGCSPLHLAAASGSESCVAALIAAGAGLDRRDARRRTALAVAAADLSARAAVFALLLLRSGADPFAVPACHGDTAQRIAASPLARAQRAALSLLMLAACERGEALGGSLYDSRLWRLVARYAWRQV